MDRLACKLDRVATAAAQQLGYAKHNKEIDVGQYKHQDVSGHVIPLTEGRLVGRYAYPQPTGAGFQVYRWPGQADMCTG